MSEPWLRHLVAGAVFCAGMFLPLLTLGGFAQQANPWCDSLPKAAPEASIQPVNRLEVARFLHAEYRRLPKRGRLAAVVLPLWLRIDQRSGAVVCVARHGESGIRELDSLAVTAAMRLRFPRQTQARPMPAWVVFPVKFLPPSKEPLRSPR